MRYTCDNFKEEKVERGERCSVGIFGEAIYAVRIFVADGHNCYHSEYYRITKEEFADYPVNAEMLIEKYYHGHSCFLCSDYMGKSHGTYGRVFSN